jgi:hypothetical protein
MQIEGSLQLISKYKTKLAVGNVLLLHVCIKKLSEHFTFLSAYLFVEFDFMYSQHVIVVQKQSLVTGVIMLMHRLQMYPDAILYSHKLMPTFLKLSHLV